MVTHFFILQDIMQETQSVKQPGLQIARFPLKIMRLNMIRFSSGYSLD